MSESQLSIRAATVEDAPVVASFGAGMFKETFGSQNNQEDMEEYISSNFSENYIRSQLLNQSSKYLLASEDSTLLSFSMLCAGQVPEAASDLRAIELVRIYIERAYNGKACQFDSKKIGITFDFKAWCTSLERRR